MTDIIIIKKEPILVACSWNFILSSDWFSFKISVISDLINICSSLLKNWRRAFCLLHLFFNCCFSFIRYLKRFCLLVIFSFLSSLLRSAIKFKMLSCFSLPMLLKKDELMLLPKKIESSWLFISLLGNSSDKTIKRLNFLHL